MDRWACVDVEVAEGVESVTARLWAFSPRVEPSSREPGVFWLDASGMRHLYPSLSAWASCIRRGLRDAGFCSVVAVGFSRFGSYAAARAGEQVVFEHPKQERAFLRGVPLACLGLEPDFRETLARLGVCDMGAFLDLPVASIRRRFGPAAEELHQLARGDGWLPIAPLEIVEPVESAVSFEYPESNLDRLVATVAGLLPRLLDQLSAQHQTLESLRVVLVLDYGGNRMEEISPAVPTMDANQVLALVRLRLASLVLTSGVIELRLHARGATIVVNQLGLFGGTSTQHLEAAERGLAQVRAQLGDGAVVCARLVEAHLPEACFTWLPLRRLVAPKLREAATGPLVRRFYTPPLSLPFRAPHEPGGWLVVGAADGPVVEVIGPQMVSGGWWARETERAYYYLRTRSGRVLWAFHDKRRRRWFLHGEVQ